MFIAVLGALLFFVSTASTQTVAVSQQQAMKKYPELAVAGSALNKAFVAEVARRKQANPAFFRAADWPMRLADELSAAPAPMVEPGPAVKKEVPAVAAAPVFEISDPALRNGKADAGPALREAIGKAIAAGPGAEVRLPAGRFRIATAGDASWQLGIGGAKGLTVRGVPGETELIFGLPDKGGIIINGGDGVFLKDLIIDSDPLPFTQGTIKSVDEAAGTFTMTVDEGYPSLAEKWFRVANQLAIESRLPNIRNYVTAVSPLNVLQHDGRNFKAKGDDNGYEAVATPRTGARLMNISGTEDRLIPYHGGPSPAIPAKNGKLGFVAAEESIFLWAKAMGYKGGKLMKPSSTVGKLEVFSYLDGAIIHYKVLGEGHGAAGAIDEATLLRFLENKR